MADELKSERVQLFMTPSEVQSIDDWSFENRVRGRSEAIRQLIEAGLNAGKPPQGDLLLGGPVPKPRRKAEAAPVKGGKKRATRE